MHEAWVYMMRGKSSNPYPTAVQRGRAGRGGGRDPRPVISDSSKRERVIKQVGLTSSTFIGPAFPPPTPAPKKAPKAKKLLKPKKLEKPKESKESNDIEDTLSEFYKELEKIDTPDGDEGNSKKPEEGFARPQQMRVAGRERTYNAGHSAEADGWRRSDGERPASWPHWYDNGPYQPRGPRPGMDLNHQNQWRHPHPQHRPPNPGLHRPPFRHPPPPAFQGPQNPPPHMNPNWSGSSPVNQYQEFSGIPSPNARGPPSQGPYVEYHSDRDERVRSFDAFSDNGNRGHDQHRVFNSEAQAWEPQPHSRPPGSSLVLILLRGLPGSGKSTLARELLSTGPSGVILGTDDYFVHDDDYCYEPFLLGEAHEWNQKRAQDAMHDRRSPIIIDNTNIQAWEMKPYVKMALERGYQVDFCEPDTSWKLDPYELQRRNKHGVSQEKIARMLDRFKFPISIDTVLSSQEPPHVDQRTQPEPPQTMGGSRELQ